MDEKVKFLKEQLQRTDEELKILKKQRGEPKTFNMVSKKIEGLLDTWLLEDIVEEFER